MRKDFSESILKKLKNAANNTGDDAMIEEWYASFDGDESPLDQMSDAHQLNLKDRMLAKIKVNIEAIKISKNEKIKSLLIASAALLLISFSLFLHFNRDLSILEDRVIIENTSAFIRKEILPDGTEIWLNPNAKVDFLPEFDQNTREVTITGEVFFDVVKDVDRPFIIYSGPIVTRVLGTSFRIRTYRDGTTEVSVSRGRVSVGLLDAGDDLILLPNQRATYLASLGRLRKDEIIQRPLIQMKFENASLKQIIKTLNIKFGVNIKLKESKLGNYTLKADFNNQNLDSILEILEKSLDLNHEIKNNEIFLQKNRQ